MSQDTTEVRRTEPFTHIINSTHVFYKSTIQIPLQELIALLKQRGLVVPSDANLTAVLNVQENILAISWSIEDENRQIATVVAFPLVNRPDPDLTAPEAPGPSSGEGPPSCPKCGEPMVTSETARDAWTCLKQDCSNLRNYSKDEPVPECKREVPAALKPTEVRTIRVEAAGRSATLNLPGDVNLQRLIEDVKAAVNDQYAQRDLDAIAAGKPPAEALDSDAVEPFRRVYPQH